MSSPPPSPWLCVLRLANPKDAATPDESTLEIIGAHFDYLSRLRDQGHVLFAGRTLDAEPMGLIVYLAPDEQSARDRADADPAVKQGVMRAEVRPFRVALEGFTRSA